MVTANPELDPRTSPAHAQTLSKHPHPARDNNITLMLVTQPATIHLLYKTVVCGITTLILSSLAAWLIKL